jgi:hypothetical protein
MANLAQAVLRGGIDVGGFLVEIGQASGTKNAAGRFRSRSQFWDPGLIASKKERREIDSGKKPEAAEGEELSTRQRSRQKSHRESRRWAIKDNGKGVKLLINYLLGWPLMRINGIGNLCGTFMFPPVVWLSARNSKTTRLLVHISFILHSQRQILAGGGR